MIVLDKRAELLQGLRLVEFPRYKVSPFSGKEYGVYRLEDGGELVIYNPRVGEVGKRTRAVLPGMSSTVRQELGEDEFVERYAAMIGELFSWRPSTIKIFIYILQNTNKKSYQVPLMAYRIVMLGIVGQHQAFYRCIRELTVCGIIARGKQTKYQYFVNPLFIPRSRQLNIVHSLYKQ